MTENTGNFCFLCSLESRSKYILSILKSAATARREGRKFAGTRRPRRALSGEGELGDFSNRRGVCRLTAHMPATRPSRGGGKQEGARGPGPAPPPPLREAGGAFPACGGLESSPICFGNFLSLLLAKGDRFQRAWPVSFASEFLLNVFRAQADGVAALSATSCSSGGGKPARAGTFPARPLP